MIFPKSPPRPSEPPIELTEADLEAFVFSDDDRPTLPFDCLAFAARLNFFRSRRRLTGERERRNGKEIRP